MPQEDFYYKACVSKMKLIEELSAALIEEVRNENAITSEQVNVIVTEVLNHNEE